ncbi:hypothetical protein [Actinomadura sp. 3N407]|uniref:hypothetical protein n=1 Tax=Actinomadura sp. 3N407 TaxID=3457423 RepID=UPI003FCE8882
MATTWDYLYLVNTVMGDLSSSAKIERLGKHDTHLAELERLRGQVHDLNMRIRAATPGTDAIMEVDLLHPGMEDAWQGLLIAAQDRWKLINADGALQDETLWL